MQKSLWCIVKERTDEIQQHWVGLTPSNTYANSTKCLLWRPALSAHLSTSPVFAKTVFFPIISIACIPLCYHFHTSSLYRLVGFLFESHAYKSQTWQISFTVMVCHLHSFTPHPSAFIIICYFALILSVWEVYSKL